MYTLIFPKILNTILNIIKLQPIIFIWVHDGKIFEINNIKVLNSDFINLIFSTYD